MQSPIQFRTVVLPRAEATERNRFLPTPMDRARAHLRRIQADIRITDEVALDLA